MSGKDDHIIELMRRSLRARKRIAIPVKWSPPDNHRASRISAPLECDDPDLTGIEMHLRCSTQLPDSDVTAQLCLALPDGTLNIERVDWRPRQPHTNRMGPDHLRGLTLYTSVHDFEANAAVGLKEMQYRNLPVVLPIDPEPQTFDELLAVVRARFTIDDMSMIPVPEWSPSLF